MPVHRKSRAISGRCDSCGQILRPVKPRKEWNARIQVDGFRFSLGYYLTREEAKRVEDDFREKFRKPWRKIDWANVVDEFLKEKESA